MRSTIYSLILLAVFTSPLARAGGEDAPAPEAARRSSNIPDEPNDADAFAAPGPRHDKKAGPQSTTVKVHPLVTVGGVLLGTFLLPVELEHTFTPSLSLYVMGTPLIFHSGMGVALDGGVRVYPSGAAPDGLWLGAQLNVSGSLSTIYGKPVVGFDLQPQVGWQWVAPNGPTVGVGVGLSLGALISARFPLTFVLPIGFTW